MLSTMAVASPTPQQVLALARTGAAQLALQKLSAVQPGARPDWDEWARWERVRIEIYQSIHAWDAIVGRANSLPSLAPDRLRVWVLLQAAEAELAQDNGSAARVFLNKQQALSPGDRAAGWLLIRSYVVESRLEQAMALITQRRERNSDRTKPRLDRLQARISLRLQQPAKSYSLLLHANNAAILPLKWLAGLRAGALKPNTVLQAIPPFLSDKPTPAQRRDALIVGAEAALDAGDAATRIRYLEQAITIAGHAQQQQSPFALQSDDIWQSLTGFGRVLGMELNLVNGDTRGWLAAAQMTTSRVHAQALCTVAALQATTAKPKTAAHQCLARTINAQPHGAELLKRLYLHTDRFPTIAAIPLPARRLLAQHALKDEQMRLAARLFDTLTNRPVDVDQTQWHLQRARAFVLGGEPAKGVAEVDALFTIDAPFAFKALQPTLFALQKVGRNKDAIRLFRKLLLQNPPQDVHQQILFWMADSYLSLHQPRNAARFYLRSATLAETLRRNHWTRAARYQAAGALVTAGMNQDARRVYQRLMNASSSAAQRAAIRGKIKALSLSH